MEAVRIWEESIVIPTYQVGPADKNPMFLETRVYQGSSGKIYPYPTVEKIYDENWEAGFSGPMTRPASMILSITTM